MQYYGDGNCVGFSKQSACVFGLQQKGVFRIMATVQDYATCWKSSGHELRQDDSRGLDNAFSCILLRVLLAIFWRATSFNQVFCGITYIYLTGSVVFKTLFF